MLDYMKGNASFPVSFGAAACMLSLLVLMGLKLRWFRARMTFDQPTTPEPSTYVGVYRSNLADAFDYRRPSVPPPVSPTTKNPPKTKTAPLNGSSVDVAGTSKAEKVKPAKSKETKSKEVKNKEQNHSGATAKVKEQKVKEVKTKEKVKEVKSKEVKVKDPKTKGAITESKDTSKLKSPTAKETKPKEAKVKELGTKSSSKSKEFDASRPMSSTPQPDVQISQNNAFPFIKSKAASKKSPPAVPAGSEKTFSFVPPQAPQLPNSSPPKTMKTFGLMEPSRGQMGSMITPIPQQEKRVIRNPAALGMSTYQSPSTLADPTYDNVVRIDINGTDRQMKTKSTASAQFLFDMDEESET